MRVKTEVEDIPLVVAEEETEVEDVGFVVEDEEEDEDIPFVVEGSSEPGGGLGSPGWRLGSAQGFGSLTQQRRGQSGGRPRPVEVDTGHIETVAWLQRLSGN